MTDMARVKIVTEGNPLTTSVTVDGKELNVLSLHIDLDYAGGVVRLELDPSQVDLQVDADMRPDSHTVTFARLREM